MSTAGDEEVACPECGCRLPSEQGPTHVYVPSSPACWRLFGEVQADELGRFGYPPTHGLVVDAYMAQHPGDGSDRRARQSVVLHLLGLCARLEHDLSPPARIRLLQTALKERPNFPAFLRPGPPGELTVIHMRGAADLADYEQRALAWAQCVWEAWAPAHDLIRVRLTELVGSW